MATVSIQQGKLKGRKSKTDSGFIYYEFLGIPYAKPPVGRLRFKPLKLELTSERDENEVVMHVHCAVSTHVFKRRENSVEYKNCLRNYNMCFTPRKSPQSAEKWNGVRDATTVSKSNVSLQVDAVSGQVIGSEDCLYLNVYSPKIPDGKMEMLPTMVYIHGGGFNNGNGILKHIHGPDFLIEHNVVLVTINYRLSVLGFLSLDIPEAAGNMGLKDQVKALQWVQENISYFGGDKNNITIFGISAGAASVDYHIVSPKSKGLFHKAILQSGSCLNPWALTNESTKQVSSLAERLGYKGSLENKVGLHDFLLDIPGTTLTALTFQIAESYMEDGIFFGFVPCIEKDFENGEAFLIHEPYSSLKQGHFNHVPVIKGFCNKEGYFMLVVKPKAIQNILEKKKFTDHWSFDFDKDARSRYEALLSQSYLEDIKPQDEPDTIAIDFVTDFEAVSGIWASGRLMARHGVPVRFYEFCYDGKINYLKRLCNIKRSGAAHTDDQTYVFCTRLMEMEKATGQDLIVRNAMTKMWTNFAKSSSPTPDNSIGTLTEWPVYTESNPVALKIDKEIKVLSNYEPKRMKIYEDIYDKHEK